MATPSKWFFLHGVKMPIITTPIRIRLGFPPYSSISDYPEYFTIGSVIDLPNDKPHFIFGYLRIDSDITLNISAGTQVYFYDQAGLWAYSGSTLIVNGELENNVVFQGSRLEEEYDDIPGQWGSIILNEDLQIMCFEMCV